MRGCVGEEEKAYFRHGLPLRANNEIRGHVQTSQSPSLLTLRTLATVPEPAFRSTVGFDFVGKWDS